MGYKKGTAQLREKQRQYVNVVARAIAHLKQKGITPETVATMKPGKGNSIRAWARAYSGAPPKTSAKKTRTVFVPNLGIVAKPGSYVILFGKDVGPNRVEVSDWSPLGKTSAKKAWGQIQSLASKNYSANYGAPKKTP